MEPNDGARNTSNAVGPADLAAPFAPPAHLVEPDRRDRPDQGEAGGEREEQWQQLVAEHEAGENQADQRIDDAEKRDVAAEGSEIVDAAGQCVAEIGDRNAADHRRCQIFPVLSMSGAHPLYRHAGLPDLVHSPFDRIADMHLPCLPNRWFEGPQRGRRRIPATICDPSSQNVCPPTRAGKPPMRQIDRKGARLLYIAKPGSGRR